MKRAFPLVLVSIALSAIVARLAATGRLDAFRARFTQSCDDLAQRIAPVVAGPLDSEAAA